MEERTHGRSTPNITRSNPMVNVAVTFEPEGGRNEMEHPEQGYHNGTGSIVLHRLTMEHSFKGGENTWKIHAQHHQIQPLGKQKHETHEKGVEQYD
jgi:hypothetical protein